MDGLRAYLISNNFHHKQQNQESYAPPKRRSYSQLTIIRYFRIFVVLGNTALRSRKHGLHSSSRRFGNGMRAGWPLRVFSRTMRQGDPRTKPPKLKPPAPLPKMRTYVGAQSTRTHVIPAGCIGVSSACVVLVFTDMFYIFISLFFHRRTKAVLYCAN